MTNDSDDAQWGQAAWQAQTESWIQAQLACLGLTRTGEIEPPRLRAWSVVFAIPTNEGALYFKAVAPRFAPHETALTVALAQWHPGSTPDVLAADVERHWMLMREGGVSLRGVLQATHDSTHWHRVLPLYAGLQQDTACRVSEMLAFDVPDNRLAVLPAHYDRLLADRDVLRIGHPAGLSADEYQCLCAFSPRFAQMCARLADYGIPETIQHDDLHDNNILVQNDRYVVFDWGDSCLTHPFCSLLVVLRSAANTLQMEEQDAPILHLRDVYLAAWSQWGSRSDLEEAATLAYRIGMICRALTWWRVVAGVQGSLHEEYAASVSGWLQEFLTEVSDNAA